MSPIQYQIIIMFMVMAVGFLAGKLRIISSETTKGLANMSLMIVNPLVTFTSYQREYSSEIAVNLLYALLISVLAFAIQITLSILIIKKRNKEFQIERLSVILSNCSYIGIPLVESVFGSEGVIYLTAYVTVFHLVTWTYGLSLMSGERDVKRMLRSFISPVIVAITLGIIFFFANLRLPDIVMSPIKLIGAMNTPLAMIIAGSTLSRTDIKKALCNVRIYFISFLRLVIIPITVLLAIFNFKELGVPTTIISIVMIALSCPTATIVTMFSHRYERNSVYSSEIFTVCTLFSVVTLPFILYIAELLGI